MEQQYIGNCLIGNGCIQDFFLSLKKDREVDIGSTIPKSGPDVLFTIVCLSICCNGVCKSSISSTENLKSNEALFLATQGGDLMPLLLYEFFRFLMCNLQ